MAMVSRLRPVGLGQHILSSPAISRIANRCPVPAPRFYATSDSLPKIANTSVWTSMIPRFIRNRKPRKTGKSKEWNPATFYIVMFTLIGSQAIRMLTLKNGYAAYRRSTDAKIELLKEVIERVKNGEKVDVEKLLGTGDETKEREWEEVLREIEAEDTLWQQRHSKDAKQKPAEEEKQPTEGPQERDSATAVKASADSDAAKTTPSKKKLNFF
ncbi:uncharacterized protein N7459_006689 [Penicillium hispanicum]|uniref:uncharacterized protein n=1 Tax=Penicillium hispanicum TaxID=1080232 RepID=UPI002540B992|nr:uncharacterized protein N7459_006689 [Penicillium hispanicum]KAJ5577725.1 hypothetical protein N7459_006689 [Penicillium hispanicum]